MSRRVFVSLLALILLFTALAPAALADDSNDRTAPHLLSVTLNAAAFDQNGTLVVTVTTDEAESGLNLSKCRLQFNAPIPNMEDGAYALSFWLDTAVSAGVATGTCALNKTDGGTYHLYCVTLVDNAGNASNYYANYMDLPGSTGDVPDVSFTLDSSYHYDPFQPDTSSTVIQSLKLSKTSAKVGDSVTITLAAANSAMISATMQMQPTSVPWYYEGYDVALQPVAGQAGVFTGTFTVTSDMPQADYYSSNVVFTAGDGKKTTVRWPSNYLSNIVLKVINPALTPAPQGGPQLTSLALSTHQAAQGQKITIRATINMQTPRFEHIQLMLMDTATYLDTRKYFTLDRQSDGSFSATVTVPPDLRYGNYALYYGWIFLPNGDSGGMWCIPSMVATLNVSRQLADWEFKQYFKGGELTVSPLISVSGADNATIPVGTPFDAAAGVTATSALAGDVTAQMQIQGGDFDTGVAGIHLVKYMVSTTVSIDGQEPPYTYTFYRWVGVTDAQPASAADGQLPLAVTAGSMVIDTGTSDAVLKKDGQAMAMVGSVSDPGIYTLTCGGQGSASRVSGGPQMASAVSASSGATVTVVVDRTGPSISAACQKKSSGMSVALKATDVSGVAAVKYLPGTWSLEDCKANGKDYAGAFVLPSNSKVTVYTRDRLGNESAKTLPVVASGADMAYLSGITLSTGNLSRAFSPKVNSYSVRLGENTGSLTVTPTPLWDGAKVTISGRGVSGGTLKLANGKSATVTIRVAYGRYSHTYRLNVTRAKSTNCALGSLTASTGILDTPFSADITTYTLNLDEKTPVVTIRTAAATVLAKTSCARKTFRLAIGQTKTVKITVRAQSGATRTYVVKIVRAKAKK